MINRRELGRLVGASVAGFAMGCGDDVVPARPLAGAAVLEPSSSALLVSVWRANGGDVRVEVRTDGVRVRDVGISLGDGGTGAIDIEGLAPSRAYEIVVTGEHGARIGTYHARTAPADDDPRPVRIAISADVDCDPSWDSELVDRMLAEEPELYISLGDFPYTDNGPDVAMTVPAYRDRHAQLRIAPHGRRLLEGVGIRAIYDDHEYRNDWDARFAAVETSRYAAAMQVWDEFFPVRGARGEVRYRNWRWGRHLECFLLDTRRFRSANADDDTPLKTMLGPGQEAWLADALARSTATFKLVLTSVPLDFGEGNDHWAAFRTARTRLYEAARATRGVVYVSADQHWFAAHRHPGGQREFQVGPLARGVGTPGPAVAGVLARQAQPNVAMLDVTADAVTLRAIGADGTVLHEESLTLDDLR
ncbi:MAG: alkaline phosphatase D family protein [Kofleriaceae bacterium]|nr:alkaline phosphatase D family protein [Kofleriaceae bacterium]